MNSQALAFASHLFLTNADCRFFVTKQLHAVGIEPGPILIEPEEKNTSATALVASLFAHKNLEAILLFSRLVTTLFWAI
tara:strand:+ start:201 stop:437 length:237 start_codon:yes stop_codon:yes gene_type:complete